MQGLGNGEQRRWARRTLETTSQCYDMALDAVSAARDEAGTDGISRALKRVQHKINALMGDLRHEEEMAKKKARVEDAQHAQHNHAAQRRNHEQQQHQRQRQQRSDNQFGRRGGDRSGGRGRGRGGGRGGKRGNHGGRR